MTDWPLEEIFLFSCTLALACCRGPSHDMSQLWRRFWLRQWWRLPCLQGYLDYCCRWGINMPAWRWQQSRLFRCSGGQRGGNRWPRSEEDIISLLSLSTPGRLDRLLLWGFSARPSPLLSISNCMFCAPRARIKILTFSKFHTKKNSLNLRILEFYTKYAKFCTTRKFPFIRYPCHLTGGNWQYTVGNHCYVSPGDT